MERREGGSRHNEEFACADEVGQQLLGLGRRQPVKQENPEHPVQVGNLRLVLVRVVDDLRGENSNEHWSYIIMLWGKGGLLS